MDIYAIIKTPVIIRKTINPVLILSIFNQLIMRKCTGIFDTVQNFHGTVCYATFRIPESTGTVCYAIFRIPEGAGTKPSASGFDAKFRIRTGD
jgi:hypothetical protein